MKIILDTFLSLVAKKGDVSPQDIREALNSISDQRVRQYLEGYWKVDNSKFLANLDIFNDFRSKINEHGISDFLKTEYSEVYDRYDGSQFADFFDSLEPITSINSFEETEYWSGYFSSSMVFWEYIRYLGNDLGYTVYASWW